jgi:hypothetical protein
MACVDIRECDHSNFNLLEHCCVGLRAIFHVLMSGSLITLAFFFSLMIAFSIQHLLWLQKFIAINFYTVENIVVCIVKE